MDHAIPVLKILFAHRLIESICVARGLQVDAGRAFAEHCLYGVSGHKVDQQEDHRHHQPQDRQSVEQP